MDIDNELFLACEKANYYRITELVRKGANPLKSTEISSKRMCRNTLDYVLSHNYGHKDSTSVLALVLGGFDINSAFYNNKYSFYPNDNIYIPENAETCKIFLKSGIKKEDILKNNFLHKSVLNFLNDELIYKN